MGPEDKTVTVTVWVPSGSLSSTPVTGKVADCSPVGMVMEVGAVASVASSMEIVTCSSSLRSAVCRVTVAIVVSPASLMVEVASWSCRLCASESLTKRVTESLLVACCAASSCIWVLSSARSTR